MMITAELAALYQFAIDTPPVSQDDSLQPVLASANAHSQRRALVAEHDELVAHRAAPPDDAAAETGERRYDRRRGDRQGASGDSGEPDDDRRKQALPTLIDTRTTRVRRRAERREVVNFAI